jgi:hypothetical protein
MPKVESRPAQPATRSLACNPNGASPAERPRGDGQDRWNWPAGRENGRAPESITLLILVFLHVGCDWRHGVVTSSGDFEVEH